MRLKLDENLGHRAAALLRRAGHEVSTVHDQGLSCADDVGIAARCREESRGLVTLDLGFANPLAFRPSLHPGIAVLRLPAKPAPQDLDHAIQTLVTALQRESIQGRLWIVEAWRVREYQEELPIDE